MRTRYLVLSLVLTACPGAGDDGGDTQTPSTPATTSITSAETAAPDPTTGGPGTSSSGTTGSAAATADDSTTTLATAATTTTGDVATTQASSTGDDTTTTGIKLDMPVDNSIPVHDIPGLESITFYETTGQVTEYTFAVNGPELNNPLADPLSMANRDIQGTSVEFYDVYYSDIDGVFDPDGRYLTIAGSFGAKLPAGGGLNLAEISLNYADNSVEYGSFLASFLGLGDNYAAGSEPNAIDGDLGTHTTMGNNVDEPNKRLRVTLGFESSLMPG